MGTRLDCGRQQPSLPLLRRERVPRRRATRRSPRRARRLRVSTLPRLPQELPKRQADLNFFDERLREMEVAVTRDPMRSKAARLRDELIRLERKQQMLSAELDGPQVAPAGFGARTANAPA